MGIPLAAALVADGSTTVTAGQVDIFSVATQDETERFGGLGGTVVGGIYLSQGNYSFHSFSAEQGYNFVIFTMGGAPNVSAFANVNGTELETIDSALGWDSSDSDSMKLTYGTNRKNVTIDGNLIQDVGYVTIDNWDVFILGEGTINSLLDVSFAIAIASGAGYDNVTVEYEALLPGGAYDIYTV